MTSRRTRSLVLVLAAIATVFGAIVVWYAWPHATLTTTQAAVAKPLPSQLPEVKTQMQTSPQAQAPAVSIDGQKISVTRALSQADQERGLGGRAGLGDHEGMLFVFPSDDFHWFWMKDMQFSIDMLWMADDGTIIYIQPNVSPATYPQAFGPRVQSRYVLEVPANFAAQYGISIGDHAILPQ